MPQDFKNTVLRHSVICRTIGPTSKPQDVYDSKKKNNNSTIERETKI